MIIRVINKIGRPRFTVLDDTKSRYQLIINVRNIRKQRKEIHLGQTIAVETISKETSVRLQQTVRLQLSRMMSEEYSS